MLCYHVYIRINSMYLKLYCLWSIHYVLFEYNNNNNIYLKPNIQCTKKYEFSGLYNKMQLQ